MIENFKASVRPALSYLFAAALIAGFLIGKVNADTFVPVAVLVVSSYFQSRNQKQFDDSLVEKPDA